VHSASSARNTRPRDWSRGRVAEPQLEGDRIVDNSARQVIERLLAEQKLIVELIERLNKLIGDPDAPLRRVVPGRAPHPRLLVDHDTAAPTQASARVAVSCFGSFQMRIGARLVDTWRQTKALALLQYLLAHHGRPSAREVLIEALWPDPEALAAGSSLKVAVHSLRRLLLDLGGDEVGLTIQAEPAGYQLCAPELWLDTEEFERTCRVGRLFDARGLREQAVEQYALAVNLYRGDFLESATAEWALLRRESLKDQYLFMLGRLADGAIEAQDYTGCILRGQQLLQHDPCREDAYRLLMIAHGRLGQRARVQSWYEVCRRALQVQLDADPEPETEQVYRQALIGAGSGGRAASFAHAVLDSAERRTA